MSAARGGRAVGGERARGVIRLLKTEDEFAGPGVAEAAADDQSDKGGVIAEAVEDALVVAEFLLLIGKRDAGLAFVLLQPPVFLVQLPKIPCAVAGKDDHYRDEQHVNGGNEFHGKISLLINARRRGV